MDTRRHPRTSAFVKHFLLDHPHLAPALAAHLRDDPDGFHATVAEWDAAGRDADPSDEPFDVSPADARRLLALAMVDAEHDAQLGGEPLPDGVRAAFRSLADEGRLEAVLGLHPVDAVRKAWDGGEIDDAVSVLMRMSGAE